MKYRKIGNTGMEAGIVGLGAEHLDNKPYEVVEETIHAALDHDINIIDLFMPGETIRTNIGRALAGKREKVLIQGHIGSCDLREQYDITRDLAACKKYFDNLLKCLKTDYIDFGMLFFVDSDEELKQIYDNGVYEYALDLKKQGKIRAIGAGAHNPKTIAKLVADGHVEMIMFSINPAFDLMPSEIDLVAVFEDLSGAMKGTDPERANLYRLCEQKGVGITVMKTLGAGKLLSPEHTPFAMPLTVGQCIHYALTRPAVASALVGCQSRAEVEEAVKYLELSAEERDYAKAIGSFKNNFKGSCVYCNHCLPCPVNIDIAAVHKYLDIAKLDENSIPPSIKQHYQSLISRGGDCISCGSCEKRCPFSVKIIENMKKAVELFGS